MRPFLLVDQPFVYVLRLYIFSSFSNFYIFLSLTDQYSIRTSKRTFSKTAHLIGLQRPAIYISRHIATINIHIAEIVLYIISPQSCNESLATLTSSQFALIKSQYIFYGARAAFTPPYYKRRARVKFFLYDNVT